MSVIVPVAGEPSPAACQRLPVSYWELFVVPVLLRPVLLGVWVR